MTPKKIADLRLLEALPGYEPGKPLPPPAVDAKAEAAKAHAEIFPKGKPPAEQCRIPCAPLPHDLARCSPFFPLDKKGLAARREWKDELVISSGPWGQLEFKGKQLAIREESVLLAILALIDGERDKETEQVEGQAANAYSGPIRPILNLMGLSDGASNYKRLLESLDLLQGCQFKLTTKRGIFAVGSPVSYYSHETGSGRVRVVLSPYFLEMFATGRVGLLDVIRRASLKGEISKALFRFLDSHRARSWEGHMLTLAGALNLDRNQEPFRIREQIKRGITPLVKAGILSRKSGIKGDIVTLVAAGPQAKAKAKAKALPSKK